MSYVLVLIVLIIVLFDAYWFMRLWIAGIREAAYWDARVDVHENRPSPPDPGAAP